MKQKMILYGLWCCLACGTIQAQQNYQKVYDKAREYMYTSSDSAILWADKCLAIAVTYEQKYKVYFLRGFNANKLCLYGQALRDYRQARHFAPDSGAYFRVNNNLANIYFYAGKYDQASKLNQQCIAFNKQAQQWVRLSYNYEVKSNILCQQKNKAALSALRQSFKLKKKHAPDQIGYVYECFAQAFSVFQVYDSALVYQQLAIEHYPIKSEQKQAILYTQLARYLILNNQAPQALPCLQKVRDFRKTAMVDLFWYHTLGLYFAKTQRKHKATHIFHYCDSLLQNLLDQAPNLLAQRSINEEAKDMYADVLELKSLQALERKFFKSRLDSAKADLARYEQAIKRRDSLYHQKQINRSQAKPQQLPLSFWYWLVLLLTLAGLSAWIIWRRTQLQRAQLTSDEYDNMLESKLLTQLEKTYNANLPVMSVTW